MVIIFDTETTTKGDDAEIIEAAHIYLRGEVDGYLIEAGKTENFRPSKPISMGAMATHHIMDEELVNCPPSSEFKLDLTGIEYIIGHNVDFDWKLAGSPDIRRIDTLAFCRKLWPQCDSHSLSAMIYFLYRKEAKNLLRGSVHEASADVDLCEMVLQKIIAEYEPATWRELWQHSELARIPEVMPFGRHNGVKISEIPRDYKDWLLRQNDVDEYLRKALA